MELVGRETHETLIAEMKRSYGLQPRLVTRLALAPPGRARAALIRLISKPKTK
jgi:hypothetical protein